MAETWISVREAADEFQYHAESIRELIRDGRVKGRKVVTVWQIERASLAAYVRKASKLGQKRGPKKK